MNRNIMITCTKSSKHYNISVDITTLFRYSNKVRYSAKHYIKTTGQPTHSTWRRLNPEKYKIAKPEFYQKLEFGIIRLYKNPWLSPLHMVPKPAWRPCGDFRRLIATSTANRYPIPHNHDFTRSLKGIQIFTKLDLIKAYYQISVAEKDTL